MTEEPFDYWGAVLADEDEDAQDAEMAREVAGSVRAAALIVFAAFGGLIAAGVICAALTWLMLRMWAA